MIAFIQYLYAMLCSLWQDIYSEQWMLTAIAWENGRLIDAQARHIYTHGCAHMWVWRTSSEAVLQRIDVWKLLYVAPNDLLNDLKVRYNGIEDIQKSSKRMVLHNARVRDFHYGNKPETETEPEHDPEKIEYTDVRFPKSRHWVKDFAKAAVEAVAEGSLPRVSAGVQATNMHWRDCMQNC